MAAEHIKVQTNDGQVFDIDETVAKKWGPIKNIIECKNIFHNFNQTKRIIELFLVTGNVSDVPQPFELNDVSSTILPKVFI